MDAGAAVDSSQNHYYLVRGANPCDTSSSNLEENAAFTFDLIPGIAATRKGRYGFDPDLVERWAGRFKDALPPGEGQIVKGRFLTVSAITCGRKQAKDIHGKLSPVMEAMEGAAAAHVAQCFNVPLIEARAASNIAGERDKDHWDFHGAVGLVGRICNRFIL